MDRFADHRDGREMFHRRNIVEGAAVGATHLPLVMAKAGEQLQTGDHRGEIANVLKVPIDVMKVQIVTKIFGKIGQSAKN